VQLTVNFTEETPSTTENHDVFN